MDRVFNPLATLAALPDDTPEVSPTGSPRHDSSEDRTTPPARVAARPPPPVSARELLARHSLRGTEPAAAGAVLPKAPPPLPPPRSSNEAVEAIPPPPPAASLEAGDGRRRAKKRPKKRVGGSKSGPREVLPLRAPPPPPGMAKGKEEAAQREPDRRATASRFVPAARPEVQDGRDCVIVGTSLKGGTVQKVLEWLVFFEQNDASAQDFVLCFDAFVPLWKVASVLRQMHEHYEDATDQARVRRFAVRLFEERCRDDPGVEGAAELLALMRETVAAAPTPRHLGLLKTVRARRAAESSLVPPPLAAFLEFAPKALAEALTRYQHEVFRSIGLEELIAWPLPARGMAGYLASTDRELHNWAVMAVGLAPQPQLAARRLLQVMEKLLAMNNFNGLMCLASGLSRVAPLLGVRQRERLATLAALVNPANNYRVFRDHVATATTVRATVFPIFDAHVGQLEFIHSEQAAYLGPSYINFRKVKLLGALFAQIKGKSPGYQQMHYDVPDNPRVFAYVSSLGLQQAPTEHALPLRPVSVLLLSRLSLQAPEDVTPNPLRSAGSQAAITNLISPRLVPPSAIPPLVAPSTAAAGTAAAASAQPAGEVRNPLYSAVAAQLPYRLQREAILRAYAQLAARLGPGPGPLPESLRAAILAPRGARGPRVGESALLDQPADEDGGAEAHDPLIAQPLKLPVHSAPGPTLQRQSSLGSGLARVRDLLSPRSKEKERAAAAAMAATPGSYVSFSPSSSGPPLPSPPPLAVPPLGSHLHHSSEAATDSTPSTGRGATELEVEGVAAWLGALGLEEHQAAFRENQINGVALLLLHEEDLRGLGVDKLLRGIAELRTLAGLPAVAVPLSPREVEGEVLQVGPDGTLHRRIARKQEQDQELYVKGVFRGTVRLMRLDAAAADVGQLYAKFRDEFGKPGTIVYKDAEGDSISIEKPSDLEYAIQDSALRGGVVKLTYAEA